MSHIEYFDFFEDIQGLNLAETEFYGFRDSVLFFHEILNALWIFKIQDIFENVEFLETQLTLSNQRDVETTNRTMQWRYSFKKLLFICMFLGKSAHYYIFLNITKKENFTVHKYTACFIWKKKTRIVSQLFLTWKKIFSFLAKMENYVFHTHVTNDSKQNHSMCIWNFSPITMKYAGRLVRNGKPCISWWIFIWHFWFLALEIFRIQKSDQPPKLPR